MFEKFFRGNIPPACEYCEYGKPTADHQMILCGRNGVVSPFFKCRKFKYDPLKRVPKVLPPLDGYSEKDFSL
ncbi:MULTISPECIES: hypothetical protein [Clostridiaceae]|uniref:Uncharacterized protein n=1 Tax=Clostridium facile TaxID=2763035 RepID=A0ABR7IPW8_9CLOT|nr:MULTISPECIES: hypothetical protein [Clostridiaceae]MBC5787180.1 hypothetical protein [Clostridium facile]PWM97972.1 MAG: hypothetical protein DBX37_07905 [Massilioclostridium sp.]PWN00229.1 MAG: hypothetical protein DBX37_02540 [Massilioclostridium sp.]